MSVKRKRNVKNEGELAVTEISMESKVNKTGKDES